MPDMCRQFLTDVTMDKRLIRILPRVQKPARYTGGEYNQIIKDKAKVDLRMALCFPDISRTLPGQN